MTEFAHFEQGCVQVVELNALRSRIEDNNLVYKSCHIIVKPLKQQLHFSLPHFLDLDLVELLILRTSFRISVFLEYNDVKLATLFRLRNFCQ